MSVFDVPELSSSTIVNDAGFVELPVVGAVQVIGKTLSEAREAIRKALSGPVKRPDINLVISEFGSQRVAVLGAVSKPGAYPLRRHVSSFSELLGEAGGLSERAGNFVQLLPSEMTGVSSRNDPTDRTLAALKAIKAGTSSKGIEVPIALLLGSHGNMPLDVPLRGGDVVIVPEAGRVTVDGEVVSRGAVQIQPGMTMMGAVGAAGGVTYSADLEQFELIRADAAGGPKHLVVNAEKVMAGEEKDVLVRSGDIIRIPSLVGRRIRQDTFDHISQFFNFGLSGALPGN
jgi:polysaccharide export outer membrane protein